EAVHRRVLAVLVVADLRVGHRLAHRGRRLGERVAAKLDIPHTPNTSLIRITIATSSGATRIAGRNSATFTSRISKSFKPTPRMSKPPTAFISRICASLSAWARRAAARGRRAWETRMPAIVSSTRHPTGPAGAGAVDS